MTTRDWCDEYVEPIIRIGKSHERPNTPPDKQSVWITIASAGVVTAIYVAGDDMQWHTVSGAGGSVAAETAAETPYTPADVSDWDSLPDNVKDAIDEVVSRIASVEDATMDHGELAGLTDISDHPGYLDLGGTRQMTGDLDMNGNGITMGNTVNEFSTDDTMAGDSDSAVPTEQAVKSYVDQAESNANAYADALIFNSNVKRALVEDQKSQNVPGGSFSAGAWRTRDLNTVVYDADNIVSIWKLAFTSGSEEPSVGDSLVGATSSATATLFDVQLDSGTWGGGDAAGIFWLLDDQTGTFGTEDIDIFGGSSNVASVSGDSTNDGQFRLKSGTYPLVNASAPGYHVNRHQARLYNITNSSETKTGTSEFSCSGGVYTASRSVIKAGLTLASATTFELQHRAENSYTNYGMGVDGNYSTEVYTQLEILME